MRKIKVVALIVMIFFASFFYSKASDPSELVPVFPPLTITAVSNPSFGGFAPPPGDSVIGIEMNNESRAYPISLLEWHGVANDIIAGMPIAVTYSFISDSAAVYSRSVDGRVLTFAVHDGVYRNNLLMLDEETQSIWSQIDGKAIKGSLSGKMLTKVHSVRTDWSGWEALHPSTSVLNPPSDVRYGIHPFGDYQRTDEILFPRQFDDSSLGPKDLVLGVGLNGTYSAYPISRLSNEGVVMDTIGSARVVIAYAYRATFVFQADNRSFAYVSDSIMEDQYANRWNMTTGIIESGNQSLVSLQASSIICYWFAWLDFHPETALFGFDSRQITERSPLEFALPWTLGLLLCFFIVSLDRYSDRRARSTSSPLRWVPFRRSILLAVPAFLMFSLVMMDAFGNLLVTNIAAEILFAVAFFALGAAMTFEWFHLRGFEGVRIPIDMSDFRENLRMVLRLQKVDSEERGATRLGLVNVEGGYGLVDPNADVLLSGKWLLAGNSAGYSAQDVVQTKRIVEMSLTTPQEELA
ncbi:MAG: DUF3179 domain-containing (seleno)protein [Thermoplasmata archaeon]